ncbi:MAG: PAS domain S-box protein [Kiritimatiellales bacterium]
MARFCESREQISPDDFRRFTAYLVKNPAVQAWEWVPVVPALDKPRVEAEARAAGLESFAIWQKTEQGESAPVAGRELYYPVLRVAPLAGNELALGYDLGSELLRHTALAAAANTGLTTTTAPVTLVQEKTPQKGLLVCRPVFNLEEPKRLRGFAVAVLRIGSLLGRVPPEEAPHLQVTPLRQGTVPEELANTCDSDRPPSQNLSLTRPLFFFDQTVAITAHVGRGFQRAHPLTAEWLVLLAGLMLTAALTKVIHTMLHGREELQQAVHDRTVALRESEQWLAATLRSIGDGVIATDAGGLVTNLNAVAERLTGWTTAEAAGRSIEEIFCIVHAKTRATVENPVGQVLCDGIGVNLANHTVLISRNGQEYQIADSCAPLLDARGTVCGAVLVVRDVTEEYGQREQLRDSEAKYRLLVDHSSDLIWNLNELGVFTYVSPSWQRVTGYVPAAITGTSLESLVHPDDFPFCQDHLQRMIQFDETLASLEFRVRHADHSWHWHAVNITLVVGPENQHVVTGGPVPFASLVGVSRDITDRKKNELRLQESESLQRLLLDSIDAGVVIIDAATHTIERVNRKGAELFGVAEKQIIGNICHRFICPAEVGRCPITDLGQEVNNSERVLVRVDGSLLPVLKSARRIRIDGQEKILGTFIDISGRKKAEEALQRATDRLSLAVRAGGVGIWDYDIVNNHLTWDDQMFRLYGIPPDQFSGAYEAWQTGIHPEDRQRGDAEIQLALTGEKDFDTEFRVVWPDGTTHNIRALATVQRDATGQPMHMIGTNWDITAQKLVAATLRESETNFRTFFETIDYMILVASPAGLIIFSNATMKRKLGYSAAELGQMHVLDIHPADVRPEAEETFTAMLRGKQDSCPLPIVTKSGTRIPVETRVWFGRWNGANCIFGVIKDLSAEQEAQQRFERLFRHNPALMALSTLPERTFADANDTFLKTLGYSKRDILGKTAATLGLFPHPEQQAAVAERLRAQRRISDFELHLRRQDGTIINGLFSGELTSSQGNQHFERKHFFHFTKEIKCAHLGKCSYSKSNTQHSWTHVERLDMHSEQEIKST